MTDIKAKALALINDIRETMGLSRDTWLDMDCAQELAVYRAIEQHEAFKREVSDAVGAYNAMWQGYTPSRDMYNAHFAKFIIAKPDPLVEAMNEVGYGCSIEVAKDLRAALAARGLKIVIDTP